MVRGKIFGSDPYRSHVLFLLEDVNMNTCELGKESLQLNSSVGVDGVAT